MAVRKSSATAASVERDLVITRVFDAPPETVFKAWTDPEKIVQWFGPPGVRAEVNEMDARQGGRYRITMRGEESGGLWIVAGVYREITPPRRLVITWTWQNDTPEHRGGHEMLVTVTFQAKGRRTEMTLRQERLESAEARDSHARGWNGSFDRLTAMLAGQRG